MGKRRKLQIVSGKPLSRSKPCYHLCWQAFKGLGGGKTRSANCHQKGRERIVICSLLSPSDCALHFQILPLHPLWTPDMQTMSTCFVVSNVVVQDCNITNTFFELCFDIKLGDAYEEDTGGTIWFSSKGKGRQLSLVERKLIKAVIDRALLQTQLSENLRNYCNISKQRKSASLEMETGTFDGGLSEKID